jgi:hypothetical protein
MKQLFVALVISITCLQACKQTSDYSTDELKIRALLAAERKAHFDRDVELFVQEFSDSMLSVNKGKVKATPPDTMRRSIGRYFNSVKFIKWDDTAPPVIRFSDDGSLAYALVQKEVIVQYPGAAGQSLADTTHFAWASVYRKINGAWKVEANISTSK